MSKKKLRALMVDDEPHCLDTLRFDLNRSCSEMLEIVGEAKNALEALSIINKEKPDLIFLDIDLPNINGMDFLESLGKIEPKVVFTTAHGKYAIPAYKFKAEGFLLKPIDVHELKAVVETIFEAHEIDSGFLNERLALPDMDGTEFISYDEIIACESSNNYCFIHLTDGKKKTVSKTLKYVESQLDKKQFLRIHQSYLINLNHIQKLLKSDGGSLQMTNQLIFPISKSHRENVLRILS